MSVPTGPAVLMIVSLYLHEEILRRDREIEEGRKMVDLLEKDLAAARDHARHCQVEVENLRRRLDDSTGKLQALEASARFAEVISKAKAESVMLQEVHMPKGRARRTPRARKDQP